MKASAVASRLLQLVPVLLGVSVIVFLMMWLTPGDPVEVMLAGQQASAEQVASLRHDMGLDRPPAERFFVFLGNAVTGNFGLSFFHRRPVADVIAERLPATIELTLAALLLALLIAIPLGIAAAVKRGSLVDRVATVGSLFGVSLPGFWFGILLLILFSVNLKLLPVSGRTSLSCEVSSLTHLLTIDALLRGRFDCAGQALRYLTLPALTLALPTAAVLMRVMRTSMIEVLRSDYVAFAEAKGLSPRRVLLRHALKNALAPTVTVAAIETGSLLGGNMVVETVFGWPGLGRLVVESIFVRNYPLVQAAVLLYAVTYVLLNFAADVIYTRLNPKVELRARSPPQRRWPPPSPLRRAAWGFATLSRTACRWCRRWWSSLSCCSGGGPVDRAARSLRHRSASPPSQPPAWLEGGEFSYLLGCDALGRDILSRIVYGARVSIVIGVVVVALATAIGIALGLAAGYLPRLDGRRHLARRRYPAGLSLPHLRHCADGDDGARRAEHRPRARLQGMGDPVPRRARRDAGHAPDGVRRGRARHRRIATAHHVPARSFPTSCRPSSSSPPSAWRTSSSWRRACRFSASACSRQPPPGAPWWRTGGPLFSTPGGCPPSPALPSSCSCSPSTLRARACATLSTRRSMIEPAPETLLSIRDLRTCFPTRTGLVTAVDGVSLDVRAGECLGVVGESGSGKSVTFASVIGLVRRPGYIAAGRVTFQGRELTAMSPAELRSVRGREIAMTMQDALTALNPALTVEEQIVEVLLAHADDLPRTGRKAEALRRAVDMLRLVGIASPERRIGDYPHQFSGGMRQRIMIAIALACRPPPAHRRRADHGARRHHPGAGAGADRRVAPPAGHERGADHP